MQNVPKIEMLIIKFGILGEFGILLDILPLIDKDSVVIMGIIFMQIVGTSKNFQKRKKFELEVSDSEDSYSTSSTTTSHHHYHHYHHYHGRKDNHTMNNNKVVQSFTPSTPPPTSVNYRNAKRRKGIPHRAPLGGLIIQY